MALDDDIAILARAPLFSLMDREALRLIAFAAEHRLLRAGDVLFRRGDKSDGGFVVTKGSLAVAGKDDDAPFIAEPGALVGQTALFLRGTRPATATAREPSSCCASRRHSCAAFCRSSRAPLRPCTARSRSSSRPCRAGSSGCANG